ncbi:MAG: heavy-metal-associated domain-containing protein [Proteobacteria bacterium]|nr:heavy-metal-associated domain-containing protein [Pseudomonadota bacterium]
MSQYQFQVAGMSCGHCVRAVEEAVQGVDPAAQVKVELAQGQVQVESAQPREAVAAAIAEAGYKVQ